MRRVDHAVVPQAGGGVVRVALVLVLLADGRLEGFFVVLAPDAALGLAKAARAESMSPAASIRSPTISQASLRLGSSRRAMRR